jgi:hypothetical protein
MFCQEGKIDKGRLKTNLRRMSGPEKNKHKAGENYIMRSFRICTLQEILLK